ncbi:putative 1-phosphatidylinositol-3-phosphate 5-kinase FAB1D [Aristolochia californica]|uniref:putative 1-phosphatidylinositol-3-phosphate 5-kinase FAB1D n=1 Tax=Aristolochia californica TaxID=171875 RepID=UPI0035DFD0AA
MTSANGNLLYGIKPFTESRFGSLVKDIASVNFLLEHVQTMCHVCGSQLSQVGKKFRCQTCAHHICGECERKENSNSSRLDGGEPGGCCKFSMEKYKQEPSKLDGLNPCGTPMISPAISLTSFDSCASSYGDISTDPSLQSRETEDESAPDTCEQDHDPSMSNVEVQEHGSLLEKVDAHGVHPSDAIHNSISVTVANYGNINCDDKGNFNNASKDVRAMISESHSEGEKDAISSFLQHGADLSQPFDIETKAQIWVPPEAEDKEDDLESSVAHNDDDDEYGDGIKWGPSSSLSCFSEENHTSHSFKEVRQKVIAEVVTGNFHSIVCQLLNSMGIGEIWKDIVASLSWEAASLIKPDGNEGRHMDPVLYLKVKCIASESREQSEVIKGLVFKKSTAHKHMTTKYKNPRLLLLKGILGQRASGLSSFNSMAEEDDYLKSITDMIELCNPNVVLVEKTVSRDLQEALLKKGITLVFDMKLPRLEKIARCTGSQIVASPSNLMNPKLKQCDFFHVDKFVEEHNSFGEGGKRSSKTLMFFEGCPKPLGCTILLKGAHSEELKKVKSVVQQAVFVAYHSILDTSFLVDQRAVVSNDLTGVANATLTSSHNLEVLKLEDPKSAITTSDNLEIFISDASLKNPVPEGLSQNVNLNTEEIHPPENDQFKMSHVSLGPPILSGYLFSSLSASLRRVLGDSFPLLPSSYQSISSYIGLNEDDLDNATTGEGLASLSPQKDNGEIEVRMGVNLKTPHDNGAAMEPSTCPEVPSSSCEIDVDHQDPVPQKDGMKTVLGPPSILVLHSSQCLTKGTAFKQRRLSRIKYYGHFDMSLGRFLHEFILNQKYLCSTCGDPPDAHIHCYIHLNGKLTVHVKQLPPDQRLPGEAEGKIWMWTRCLKCEWRDGIPISTGRVVMATASRGLSFGKLLELSFSSHCASRRLSSCGHSLHRDCLHFYGLGSIVAMFRYSHVDFYVACNPPPILEFNNPNGQEWLYREAQDVLAKGHLLFAEVMNSFQKIQSRFSGLSLKQPVKLGGSVKGFTEIEDMLKQEKSDFEASLGKAVNKNRHLGQIVHQILNLNRLNHELLLELYVWDRRLHYLLSSAGSVNGQQKAQLKLQSEDILTRKTEDNNIIEYAGKSSEDLSDLNSRKLVSPASVVDSDKTTDPACGQAEETCLHTASAGEDVHSSEPLINMLTGHVVGNGVSTRPSELPDQGNQDNALASQRQVELAVLDEVKPLRQTEPVAASNNKLGATITDSTLSEASCNPVAQSSVASELQNPEGWVWTPFAETRKAYRKDLQRGYSQRFEFINSYRPEHLSSVDELITQERSRLHFPVGTDDDVVSVYEDEFTSIIACALALSLDKSNSFKTSAEKETREVKGGMDMEIETQYSLASDVGMASPYWSSNGSFDFDGIHLAQTVSSQELSGSDLFSPVDPLHPEISLGGGKLPGKGKYSVICVHAKQFFALRRRCCPSELNYISSLSRCKKWDAQGGKSKVFFAKTLDDRFIVKQVKKTELDSFLKFAPEYFKHISESLSTGSQSCLAKILGIYQVIIRQDKNGKELKIDLMVMENLLFGRNVSRLYDLKGALHSRYISDANGPGTVLLDQNFVEDMLISPMYISGKTKHIMERAIWNDTCFLTSINVMDYSLLVGVDQQKREIVFGIIDYLRQYTWDKHLETWVKSSLVVPKNALPTVISPKEYKKRFRKFMSTYFLTLPDWDPDRLSESSELCEY